MLFRQIFDEKLAQYAYLIGCQKTGEAIIIDPERDIDRYISLAEKEGLSIVAAADTHIHADYISGLREFAERGIKVYASDEGDENWKYEWLINSDGYSYQLLKDGDTFTIGNIKFKASHTPGHTPEHMAYEVVDGATGSEPMGLLTGDFVFVGDVGRPDLLESAAGVQGNMEPSARTLYNSVQKFKSQPEYLQVWPGHGAGSACGKALGSVPESTVGYELRYNASIAASDTEDNFVSFILEGQPEPPYYFARMKRDNKMGPKILGQLPEPRHLAINEIDAIVANQDAVIIDTRDAESYMNMHLPNSILAPLNKQFNTIAGSYVEEDEEVYLIVDEHRLHEAVVDLIRIGLDNIRGYATPEIFERYREEGGNIKRMDMINFDAVDDHIKEGAKVLDVRKQTEFEDGHLPDAVNIAHTRLLARKDELDRSQPYVVHCAKGARAAVASAFLEREGFSVKHINDRVAPYLQEHNLVAQ